MRYFWTLVLITMWSASCQAANIWKSVTSDGMPYIAIDGDLVEGDDRVFKNLAITLDQATVALNSRGGLAMVGVEIGKTILIKGFKTAVLPDFMCSSACGLAWLAGRPRLMFEGAKVGFHAIYTVENGSNNVSSDGNALVGSYLTQLGLSDGAIRYVTIARPESILWLTMEDARAIGLEVTFVPAAETAAIQKRPENTGADIPTPESADRIKNSQETVSQETSTAPPAIVWKYVSNVDLSGFDLPSMPLRLTSASACLGACERNASCTAFTFNEGYRACFLKWGASEALQFTGAYSGYKSTNSVVRVGREHGADVGFRTNMGSEITAVPYSTYLGKSLSWCQDDCIDDFQCRAFTFYRSGACVKFHVEKPTRLNPEVYSGIKTQ